MSKTAKSAFKGIGRFISKVFNDLFTSDDKTISLNKVMILIWFVYLLRFFEKVITVYGTVIAKGSVVSMIEPAFAITIFVTLCGYEFVKKTKLNKKYKINNEEK